MIELIEKTLLTAIGAASLSQKKAEELLQELKERFQVTEDEGKTLLDKLQAAVRENQKKLEEQAEIEVKKACERLGLITREEFETLNRKVQQLEERLAGSGN